MPKKLLISTLITVGALASTITNILPVNAEELQIDGKTYWTYDEVQVESEKYLEHRKMCKGDFNCESYLDTAYILTEDVHGAAKAFADYYFMITAIDPNAATIKVLFHNDSARGMISAAEPDVFKNLYLSWWEPGTAEYSIAGFTGESNNPNRHEIYTRVAEEGEEWLPANTEVEISISKEAIEALKTTNIFWAAQSKFSNALSERDFTSCLTEVEGLPGYECRAVFDFMGNIKYHKTAIKQAPAPEMALTPAVETTPTAETATTVETASAAETTTTEKISTSTMRVPETITEVAQTTTSEVATEGTTGTITEVPLAAGKKEEHEFPWWLVVFIFSGIFLVLWWLIPTKKFEKSLDKTDQIE